MKITNSAIPRPANVATSTTSAAGRTAPVAGSNAAANAAPAAATDSAARLSQLEAQFSQSDFDVSKVNEVTAAIASGQYTVNAGAIADGLLDSSLGAGDASQGNG
jgi:flagellar biosynthesis anti-sigma factor FlgM